MRDELDRHHPADTDVALLDDALYVVDLLAEGLQLARLEVFALEQSLFAHAIIVRLAESAGAAGLLGLGVDAFHRLMR